MTTTGLVCGACGIELPENAKFCLECGTSVSMATKTAEYKQVTMSAKIACFDQGVRSRAADADREFGDAPVAGLR